VLTKSLPLSNKFRAYLDDSPNPLEDMNVLAFLQSAFEALIFSASELLVAADTALAQLQLVSKSVPVMVIDKGPTRIEVNVSDTQRGLLIASQMLAFVLNMLQSMEDTSAARALGAVAIKKKKAATNTAIILALRIILLYQNFLPATIDRFSG